MKVREIEEAIEKLSPDEVGQLASWFENRFQSQWDVRFTSFRRMARKIGSGWMISSTTKSFRDRFTRLQP